MELQERRWWRAGWRETSSGGGAHGGELGRPFGIVDGKITFRETRCFSFPILCWGEFIWPYIQT